MPANSKNQSILSARRERQASHCCNPLNQFKCISNLNDCLPAFSSSSCSASFYLYRCLNQAPLTFITSPKAYFSTVWHFFGLFFSSKASSGIRLSNVSLCMTLIFVHLIRITLCSNFSAAIYFCSHTLCSAHFFVWPLWLQPSIVQ